MDTRFLTFVWRHSKREQLIILAITLLSFPFVYLSLELPKIIVNDAIDGGDFPRVILGAELGQIPYLLLLCFVFLGLVVLINGFKWVLNIAVGMCGERMLRRMRFMLFEHVMRFRMGRFRTTKPGEVIQSMLGEIEPLGGFFGEVIATPAFQGGLLVVYAVFIFMQDIFLGLAAIMFYPLQAWLIPKLQQKVIRLNKERARTNRGLADTIAESVDKISDIHANDTPRWHMAQVSGRLYRLNMIRLDIYKRKFTIKFITNFLNQLIPFLFYAIGGYLVIEGRLDFGSLVAVLAAYKDLAAPWRSVLSYVQRWADFNGRFTYVVEGFTGDDVMPPDRVHDYPATPLEGDMQLRGVEGGPGTAGLTVPHVTVPAGARVAVTGGEEGAREAALRLMAGLAEPAEGEVSIGGRSLPEATLPELGATLGYVGNDPGMIPGTLRDNMLYGLFRDPPVLDPSESAEAARFVREARATGNPATDPEGDWVDYAAAGVRDAGELEARLMRLVDLAHLSDEVVAAALSRRLGPEEAERWSGPILRARARFAASGADLADLVEPWLPDAYNTNGPLLHNLLFALPVTEATTVEDYAADPRVLEVLEATGALPLIEEIGWDIAREFAELAEAVEADSPVLESFPGYAKAEVQAAAALVAAHPGQERPALGTEERRTLRALALKFVETRDRLDVLGAGRKARVLEARAAARARLADGEGFVAFDAERVNPARTVAGNILAGQRRLDRRSAWRGLDEAIEAAIEAEGLRPELIRLGLDSPVGQAGLTANGRRRLALVRGLISRPRFLIVDGIAGGATETDAALRARIGEMFPGVSLIYAATDTEEAVAHADRVLGIDQTGRMTELTGARQ